MPGGIVVGGTGGGAPGGGSFSAGVSTLGNTAGSTGTVSNQVVFAGGNNITLSQSTGAGGATITISGANVGGAQTGISSVGNSQTTYTSGAIQLLGSNMVTVKSTTGQGFVIDATQSAQTFLGGLAGSNTTYTSGTVTITGVGGGVTVSSNTGQRIDISVAAQSVQTQNLHNVTISGNTSGALAAISSGTLTIAGGNNITISQAGNAITISGPNVGGAQTGISGIANSETTYTSGTVSFSALGNLTIRSTTGNQFQFSVATQTVQPETQTFVGGIGNSQTTYTSGTVNLSVVGGNMTIRSTTGNALQFSVSQSVQAETQTFLAGLAGSNTTYSSGTVTITGVGGGVTVSSNTGQRIDISVAAPVAQTNQAGTVFAASNTFGTSSGTFDARTLSIAGDGIISVAASNSGWRISATQSVQTQNRANVTLSGNTAGVMAQISSGTMTLAGGNGITLSQNGNAVTISGGAGGAGMSAGLSNVGNTAGNTDTVTGRLVFAGGNNITLSGSTNGGSMTITVSAPNLGAGAMSAGVSNLGNTAGSTGITGTQMVLVGSGPVSLSQSTGANGGTVSINAPATSSLSATGALSISTNGSTISLGVPYITAANWENMPAMQAVLYTHLSGVSKTPFYWIENLPHGIQPKNIAMRISMVTASQPLSLSIHFGIYAFANSTSAALLGSASDAFVVSSASSVSLSGQRNLVLTSPGTVAAVSSLTPGNYLFGVMFSATATNAMNASIYAASAAAGPRLGLILPGTNQLSTGTSQGIAGLYGRGSTTVNAMPSNVVASEVVNQGIGASSPMKPYIFIRS